MNSCKSSSGFFLKLLLELLEVPLSILLGVSPAIPQNFLPGIPLGIASRIHLEVPPRAPSRVPPEIFISVPLRFAESSFENPSRNSSGNSS